MEEAARGRRVELDDFERDLYGALVSRLRANGHAVPRRIAGMVASTEADWVTTVWSQGPVGEQG